MLKILESVNQMTTVIDKNYLIKKHEEQTLR